MRARLAKLATLEARRARGSTRTGGPHSARLIVGKSWDAGAPRCDRQQDNLRLKRSPIFPKHTPVRVISLLPVTDEHRLDIRDLT